MSCCRCQGSRQDGRAAPTSPAQWKKRGCVPVERAQLCQGATRTLLGSPGSTAGQTPAQTQLLGEQTQIKMGLS